MTAVLKPFHSAYPVCFSLTATREFRSQQQRKHEMTERQGWLLSLHADLLDQSNLLQPIISLHCRGRSEVSRPTSSSPWQKISPRLPPLPPWLVAAIRAARYGNEGAFWWTAFVYYYYGRSLPQFAVSRLGPAVRLVSGRTSVRFRFGSPLSSKVVVCGHCLATLSLTINETLKWLSSLPILMQHSFW